MLLSVVKNLVAPRDGFFLLFDRESEEEQIERQNYATEYFHFHSRFSP